MKGSEGRQEQDNSQQTKIENVFERLKTTTNIVGGDFGMKVQIGRAGEGSYFDPQEVSITFDPNHLLEDPELVEQVAIHEGAHRAVSRGPEAIGLKKEEIPKIFDQLGFNFLYQSVEDNAVNTWASDRFDYGKDLLQESWKESLRQVDESVSKDAFFGTDSPEVKAMVQLLGHTPKFMHYGTEVRRWWLDGRFREGLDPEVELCLERTIKAFEDAYRRLPSAHPNEKEVVQKAKERFIGMYSNVWPEYKKLVDSDITEEKLSEMIKEELEKIEQELKNQKSPLDDLPPDLRQELEDKINEATREFNEQQEKEIEANEEKPQSADGDKSEDQTRESEGEGSSDSNGKEENSENNKEEGAPEKESVTEKSTDKSPEKSTSKAEVRIVPIDKFSDELKSALKTIFDKLPQDVKDKLIELAKKKLAQIEDAINKEIQSKLLEENAPTHDEIQILEEQMILEQEREEKDKEDSEKLSGELEKTIESQLTEYDRHYREVIELVNDLYDKVERIFQPDKQPRWKKGYSSGGRLDLQAAREFERDPSKYTGLWERKTVPHKRDYRFLLLVDLSDSMYLPANGEQLDMSFNSFDQSDVITKLQETFKGVIVLTEVLNKLRIDNEVVGFSSDLPGFYRIYKKFGEILSSSTREKIAKMLVDGGGSTPTHQATLSASELLEKKGVNNQYLVTLTDGAPNDALRTKEVIAKIRKNTKQKLIGIGLGEGTEFVGEYYPASVTLPDVSQLSDRLATLFEEMIRNPEKYK